MNFTISTAQRKQAKLRIAVSGPSGSGKTMSALLLAKGLVGSWDKIVVIDTENGSAELYSHIGDFKVIRFEAPYSPERYVEAIEFAIDQGAEAIVIDSTSHEWDGKGGCLEINELIAQNKFRGNSWAAWSETTPRHQRFIQSITTSPIHMITTARSKTEVVVGEDKKAKKVGMKDIQRDGFEYEMTISFNIDRDSHMALASKDRTGLFANVDPFMISEETGKKIKLWNEDGKVDEKAQFLEIVRLLDVDLALGIPKYSKENNDRAEFIKGAVLAITDKDIADRSLWSQIIKDLRNVEDKGKAYALAWGEQHLEDNEVPPDDLDMLDTIEDGKVDEKKDAEKEKGNKKKTSK